LVSSLLKPSKNILVLGFNGKIFDSFFKSTYDFCCASIPFAAKLALLITLTPAGSK
jgi:hypothetical protein